MVPLPPPPQWFIRSQGDKSSATIVPLAWAAASNDNAALNTNPPGGITHAVQLVSVADDYSGIIEPYIMYPTEAQTSPYPRPVGAPTGMFNGVRGLAGLGLVCATCLVHFHATLHFNTRLPPFKSSHRPATPP